MASTIVSAPSRPQNIMAMMISRPNQLNSFMDAVLRPVVAKAETMVKRASSKVTVCVISSSQVVVASRMNDTVNTASAGRIASR